MKPYVILPALAAATLFATTACGESTSGQAQPAADTTTTSSPSNGGTSGAVTSPSNADDSLGKVDPCTLLTKNEAAEVGASNEPKPEKIGSARTCRWKPQNALFSVVIRTNAGVSDVQAPGEVTDITVGHHQAKKFVGAGGSCTVAMGVTSSSRVDIVLNADSRVDPCPPTLRIAELVEPKLP